MLLKPVQYVYVAGTPGQAGQPETIECPPPPPPPGGPGDGGGGPPNSGGGGCPPEAPPGSCCSIILLPNEYGILVPTLVCV